MPERKSDGETDNLTGHLYGYTFIYERVNGIERHYEGKSPPEVAHPVIIYINKLILKVYPI